jgi:lysophospholipase L1-like esterase
MAAVPLDRVAGFIDGAIDIRRRDGSLQPIRYPAHEAAFYDPFTRLAASCPAGVRLRFISGATTVRLGVDQRLLGAVVAQGGGAYDLFIDGTLARRTHASGGATLSLDGGVVGDETATVVFDDLPHGEKRVELWLPASGTVSIRELRLEGDEAPEPWPDTRRTVLFHGSSITHCVEATGASEGWPAVAAGLANLRHINLGWGGSCLLSGLAARIIRDQDAALIVLKLGVNVWSQGLLKERTFADSAHAVLSIIRERQPETPIQVISPIFSPVREDEGDAGGLSLTRMRDVLEEVVAARRDPHTHYLSGLALFGEADAADLPDNLHPNTRGYRRMGERFHALKLSGAGDLLGAKR